VPALYAATPGYDLIEEVGPERIRANSLRQTELLRGLVEEAGFEVRSPREPYRRGGTLTVRLADFQAVHRELGERGVICDFRPGAGIRLGPHFFNERRGARARRLGDAGDRRLGCPAALGQLGGSVLAGLPRALVNR